MWCTIQNILLLCVVSVVTMMVIGIDIATHDIHLYPLNIKL
jgi:hypothetical protein